MLENWLEMLVGNVGWKIWLEMLAGNLAGKFVGNVGWKNVLENLDGNVGWKCWLENLLEKMLVNGCEIVGEKIVATNLPLRLSTTIKHRVFDDQKWRTQDGMNLCSCWDDAFGAGRLLQFLLKKTLKEIEIAAEHLVTSLGENKVSEKKLLQKFVKWFGSLPFQNWWCYYFRLDGCQWCTNKLRARGRRWVFLNCRNSSWGLW